MEILYRSLFALNFIRFQIFMVGKIKSFNQPTHWKWISIWQVI